jgi:ribosomal protein S12 methylthiotransferase accessory factor
MAIQLTLPKGFPEKYKGGIVRAMELCAVKRHITEAPEFVIDVE